MVLFSFVHKKCQSVSFPITLQDFLLGIADLTGK